MSLADKERPPAGGQGARNHIQSPVAYHAPPTDRNLRHWLHLFPEVSREQLARAVAAVDAAVRSGSP